MTQTKKCTSCKKVLALDCFYLHTDRRLKTNEPRVHRTSRCKDCTRVSARWSQLMTKYGISQEQYETLYDAQGGRCAICGTTEPARGHRFFGVDHDHATGAVRGLLCHYCNPGLGNFRDDPNLLIGAAMYLLGTDAERRAPIEAARRRNRSGPAPTP